MSSSGGEDDVCGEVGFMFDSALPKAKRLFNFGSITVSVRLVDDDPGAVQSGHYVWPAAPVLCHFLIKNWASMPHGAVLELGAGCGLGGLVTAALPGTTAVVMTDHDPGVLDLIRETIAEQDLESSGQGTSGGKIGRKARCVQLSWGQMDPSQRAALVNALASIELSRGSSVEQHQVGVAASVDRAPQDMGGCETPQEDAPACCDGSSESSRVKPTARPGQRRDPVTLAGRFKVTADAARGGASPGEREEAGGAELIQRRQTTCRGETAPSFELMIASDVIYSVSVVEPLFQTVNDLLGPGASVTREDGEPGGGDAEAPTLVMCQSFGYDAETEEAIDSACERHGLVREIVWDELARGGGASSSRHAGVSGAVSSRSMSGEREEDGRVELGEGCGQDARDREREGSEGRSGTKLQLFRRRRQRPPIN